jgi:hypothetical protein
MKRFMGLVFMVSLLKEEGLRYYKKINAALCFLGRRFGSVVMKDAWVGLIEGRTDRLRVGNGVLNLMVGGIGLRRAHTHRP